MPYTGLTVVIPTRNRAKLAMNAIRSVLGQSLENIQILVSDNSTIGAEANELSAFCKPLTNRGVHYIDPPKPMPMSRHWDWAMEQSLGLSASNHITFLTDRMIFKKGKLAEAIEIAKHHPNKLLCYTHDKVIDHKTPIRMLQTPWTGNVFEISSERLLFLISRATLHGCLPRMLNSIVPRSSIHKIQAHFGNVFDSISPDFNFCFRFLKIFDTILYFDTSVLLHYALYRSNGESVAIGKSTTDHMDFIADLGGTPMNFAAPIPQFRTVFNAICHEYCLIKEENSSDKFRKIDQCAYLKHIAQEIDRIENPSLKLEMEALLVTHGWQGLQNRRFNYGSFMRKLFSTRSVVNRLKWLSGGSHTKWVWLILVNLFGIHPPDDNRFGFQTAEEAIEYANRFPRRKDTDNPLGEPLSSATELGGIPLPSGHAAL